MSDHSASDKADPYTGKGPEVPENEVTVSALHTRSENEEEAA